MDSLSITTQPSVEPITTAEAKTHLRVEHSSDDTFIDTLITAARRACERYCGAQFCTATYSWKLDCFTAVLWVPRPPLMRNNVRTSYQALPGPDYGCRPAVQFTTTVMGV